MIREFKIRGYQSLGQVSIKLGRFTVVTGHTGSGKSSIIRAIKLLAANARGVSYIRHGEKSCSVTMLTDYGTAVRITRGKGVDAYDVHGAVNQTAKFTKLGGKVPDQVKNVLGITDLNFAGQFDRPYLLDASGGEVARTLGELTNVTVILRAAQEAQRRKKAVAAQQREVQARLTAAKQDVQRFKGMPARRAAIQAAEVALSAAREAEVRLARLGVLTDQLSAAVARRGAANLAGSVAVPGTGDLEDKASRLTRLEDLIGRLKAATYLRGEADKAWQSWTQGAGAADLEYERVLREAGRCPVCGQDVSYAKELGDAKREHEISQGGDGSTVTTGHQHSPFGR